MQVFGHKFFDDPAAPYMDGTIDRVRVKFMLNGTHGNASFFTCSLCRRGYRHWLCDDKVWRKLPKAVQRMYLCPDCFTAIRTLQKKGLIKE